MGNMKQAGDLISVLEEANQTVNPKLYELHDMARGSSGRSRSRRGMGGSRNFRDDFRGGRRDDYRSGGDRSRGGEGYNRGGLRSDRGPDMRGDRDMRNDRGPDMRSDRGPRPDMGGDRGAGADMRSDRGQGPLRGSGRMQDSRQGGRHGTQSQNHAYGSEVPEADGYDSRVGYGGAANRGNSHRGTAAGPGYGGPDRQRGAGGLLDPPAPQAGGYNTRQGQHSTEDGRSAGGYGMQQQANGPMGRPHQEDARGYGMEMNGSQGRPSHGMHHEPMRGPPGQSQGMGMGGAAVRSGHGMQHDQMGVPQGMDVNGQGRPNRGMQHDQMGAALNRPQTMDMTGAQGRQAHGMQHEQMGGTQNRSYGMQQQQDMSRGTPRSYGMQGQQQQQYMGAGGHQPSRSQAEDAALVFNNLKQPPPPPPPVANEAYGAGSQGKPLLGNAPPMNNYYAR